MNCEQAQALANGYIEGELPLHEQAQMESHLAACHTCAAELAAYRLLGERTRQAGSIPSELLRSRIASEISSSRRQTREVRNMKTKLSLALGTLAVAAVTFIALRPTEAFASLDQVKAAMKKAKKMHAVATVKKGDSTLKEEVWAIEGAMRIEAAGKPARIVKGEQVWVQKADDDEIVFEIADIPKDGIVKEGTYTFQVLPVIGKPLEGQATAGAYEIGFVLVADEPEAFQIVGSEEIDGKQTQKAILHRKGAPYRTVLWLDPITHLPVVAERQKKNGEIWDVISQVKYDFTKPIPPSLFEPKQK